jgi:hypothetical protein
MTQNPGQWGSQGGYPPQGQGSYPPQQQPAPGFPPQQPGQGYPAQGGYPPQPGYNPQGTYAPQGGYPPQGGAGGYGPQGPQPPQGGGGYTPQPAPPAKKSPAMIIGIVVAAVVLLAAIGGIIMVLNRGGDQPPPVSITPSQPVPPTEQPTEQPTDSPTDEPTTTDEPQPTPSESSAPPSGDAVDLAHGISLTPAPGWEVKKTGQGVAQLSDGDSIFLGQAIKVDPSTNSGQLCDAWHRKVAEGSSNGKFSEPKSIDVGTTKLDAAVCNAQVTVSNGQGTATVVLFSLVSVRQSDGVTVLGTAYFTPNVDTQKLDEDFSLMVNSMLQIQANG